MPKGIADISSILEQYTAEVTEAIQEEAIAIGNECVKELKSSGNTKRTGNYNKGWETKVVKGTNFINVVVHNKDHYRLTHLLEYGHATRSGGRTKATVHIKPVEEKATANFIQGVEQIVSKGGK